MLDVLIIASTNMIFVLLAIVFKMDAKQFKVSNIISGVSTVTTCTAFPNITPILGLIYLTYLIQYYCISMNTGISMWLRLVTSVINLIMILLAITFQ